VRRRILPILISLAGAALIGLLVYGISTKSSNRTLDELVAKGAFPQAPDATRALPVLQGHGTSSLAAYRGKVVVMNLWASWCVPCQAEAPKLERAQSELKGHDGTVLGITYEDAAPDSVGFIHRNHLTYPDLRDNTGDFARAFGTNEVPESFLIDREGRIVAIERGELQQNFLNKAIKLATGA
jgi:cytochrome c biogenesis protein CcmG, thiol:disulfide interchange protein DsbE